MKTPPVTTNPFEGLQQLAMDLRDKNGGCPWDQEQTHQSLIKNLVEESYEVIDAINALDYEKPETGKNLREELGDLLFQVVIHSQLAAEKGLFTFAEVAQGILEKLIYRHPHVYTTGVRADTSGDVLKNWEQLKEVEKIQKNQKSSVLQNIPRALPALLKSQKLGEKAARYHFDWEKGIVGKRQLRDKILEEIEELWCLLPDEPAEFENPSLENEIRNQAELELGDILFALAQLGRRYHIDPEKALSRTNEKFTKRFQYIEKILGDKFTRKEASIQEMELLWEKSKESIP